MSPRAAAVPRLRRVLAMLPYIAEHPEVRIDELAQRFAVGPSDVERDLELLPFCGLPPYTPDRLIDLTVIDGHVSVRLAEYFERALRLSANEGLAVLAAGRALLAVPGSDPDGALARALTKLAEALDGDALAVEIEEPEALVELRRAATNTERVEIDYYSFGRDELTSRAIDPRAVFHAFGQWYVDAWCHRAEDERLFRVDRVRAVRRTGEHFEPTGDSVVDRPVYSPRPSDPRVTLWLAPEAAWVIESFPAEAVAEADDGSTTVTLAVSERAWLERLLLRLGPHARVLDPPDWRDAGAHAARRVLVRYAS